MYEKSAATYFVAVDRGVCELTEEEAKACKEAGAFFPSHPNMPPEERIDQIIALRLFDEPRCVGDFTRSPANIKRLTAWFEKLERSGTIQRVPAPANRTAEPGFATLLNPECSQLFYVFTGNAVALQMPVRDFLLHTGLANRNAVIFQESSVSKALLEWRFPPHGANDFYRYGLTDEVASIEALLGWQRGFMAANPHISEVYALGTSVGAFSAIIFGHQLRVSNVYAFAPEHTVAPDAPEGDPLWDLETLLAKPNGVTKYHIYFNMAVERDRGVAVKLSKCEGVSLFPQAGNTHVVVQTLWKQNKLGDILPKFKGSGIKSAGAHSLSGSTEALEEQLLRFLKSIVDEETTEELTIQSELDGVLSSLQTFQVFQFVQSAFGIQINPAEVRQEDFASISGLVSYVKRTASTRNAADTNGSVSVNPEPAFRMTAELVFGGMTRTVSIRDMSSEGFELRGDLEGLESPEQIDIRSIRLGDFDFPIDRSLQKAEYEKMGDSRLLVRFSGALAEATEPGKSWGKRYASYLADVLGSSTKPNAPPRRGSIPSRPSPLVSVVAEPDDDGFVLSHWAQRHARHRPDDPAIIERGRNTSWKELNSRADELAALIHAEAKPSAPVVLFFDQSAAYMAAILGCMKAGRTYVPLDPSQPSTRIEKIFEQVDVGFVLIAAPYSHIQNSVPDEVACLLLPQELSDWCLAPPSSDAARARARLISTDACYIMFTSGSTGMPKGVVISHGAVLNYALWVKQHAAVSGHDRVLGHAPTYFDLSLYAIVACFYAGAALVPIPRSEGGNARKVYRTIRDSDVTVWISAPYLLTLFARDLDLSTVDLSRLRTVSYCGETLPNRTLVAWMKDVPQASYHNLYGPTEATCSCVAYRWTSPPDLEDAIPIGQAHANMRALILDDNQNEITEVETVGELCLQGVQLADGYLNNPEATAAAFFYHQGKRTYRTGDLAKLDKDGLIIFLGRIDHQVKVRGYRIELGEIEAALLAQDSVRQCCVSTAEEPLTKETVLVGFVESGEIEISESTLKAALSALVPGYMVPERIFFEERLPLTPSGKIDRREVAGMGDDRLTQAMDRMKSSEL